MKYAPLDINKIRELEADIQTSVKQLRAFAALDASVFVQNEQNYAIAEHHFRRALEGVLTIGTHIVSRLPEKTKDYQDVIVALGKHGIIPKDFAEKNKKLAGYRNRMVHLYWEVMPEELHGIIGEHVGDLDSFCEYFREVVRDPGKFGMEIEE